VPTYDQVITAIHDDECGAGTTIVFPTMSTCIAVICVLDTTLVGIHKTMTWDGRTTALFQRAIALINGATINELYLLGWDITNNAAHDLAQIRTTLGATAVPTYTCNYTNSTYVNAHNKTLPAYQPGLFWKPDPTTDLATFAWHKGRTSPDIGVKRSSKVTVVQDQVAKTAFRQQVGVTQYDATQERVQKASTHFHVLRRFIELHRM